MAGQANGRVALVVARTVERFVAKFDFAALDEEHRIEALREVMELRRSLGARSELIDIALARLERALNPAASARKQANPLLAMRLARMLRALKPLAMVGAAAGTMLAVAPAFAANPIPTKTVGDPVYNPVSHSNETVVEVIGSPGYAVRTDQNHIILLVNEVGQTYTATDSSNVSKTYTVTAVTKTTYNGTDYVTSVTVKDASNNSATAQVVNDASYTTPPPGGADGSGSTQIVFPPASGDLNRVDRVVSGDAGDDGRDGGGIKVCIPLIGCATIAVEPTSGGRGDDGPTVNVPPPSLAASIQTTANNRAAIIAGSIGGNGGQGGDGYGVDIPGARGGGAGNGGTVTAVVGSGTTIVTSGNNSQGIFVKSAAGQGGSGGSGYIASGGGSGGSAARGGSASVYNNANIQTTGNDSAGILVQSLGGGSGDGGSSYGIVGSAGSGSVGGNGGSAFAENGGTIVTWGIASYGIQAQSIGGSGGSSGSAGGLVAFGGSGGGAGTGGTATIHALSTSNVTTHGDLAHGLFAQSIGGGGGSTGAVGGLVSLGGSAASGGVGGNVFITADDGSYIETFGKGAFGIFAESIGGSGGSAGSTGGLVTIGGSAGSGNNAGNVTVASGSTILTHDKDSRGIFAQSVGGGGGSANGSGGLVSLGGSGSAGGQGGTVTVTLTAASHIETLGEGADGVFAQSIGGGGGAGASSGGLVALGGKGGSGGAGGTVTLSNAGSVTTGADFSRGLFAQSIGGGRRKWRR